jgi:hypothetical protein
MSTGDTSRDYSVFGLRIRSTMDLPELFTASGDGTPDVWIDQEKFDSERSEPGLVATDRGLLLTVAEVGRFLISDGRTIRVQPDAGVDPRNVRLFLLGSAFGALLHQRGLLPLHANAVEVDGRAFAFMGHSGAGKSTLATWFHDQGHRVLADDVCVVRFDDSGEPLACPGLPRLRLWLDVIELTGRESAGLDRSYVGASAQLDKFDVPVNRMSMIHGDVPIAGLYLLAEGNELSINSLAGVDAAEAIFENTYRGAFIAAASAHRNHWRSAMALARNTPVFKVERSMNLARFDDECRTLRGHLTEVAAGMRLRGARTPDAA